jgi:hypothetical protein
MLPVCHGRVRAIVTDCLPNQNNEVLSELTFLNYISRLRVCLKSRHARRYEGWQATPAALRPLSPSFPAASGCKATASRCCATPPLGPRKRRGPESGALALCRRGRGWRRARRRPPGETSRRSFWGIGASGSFRRGEPGRYLSFSPRASISIVARKSLLPGTSSSSFTTFSSVFALTFRRRAFAISRMASLDTAAMCFFTAGGLSTLARTTADRWLFRNVLL